MADYYPTYLNLAGKKCVIIGGGTIAQGKIAGFRDAGATITLISPDATPGIRKAANDGYIQWFERKYEQGDLKGAFIAVAATNVWHINREIFDEAERLGVLLNVVDDPDLCTFIAPSLVKRDPVTLAISTGGASPALARKLRETLSDHPALEWADLANVLSKTRQEIKELRLVIDPNRWQCCITRDLLKLSQEGRDPEAQQILLGQLTNNQTNGLCPNLDRCEPGGCSTSLALKSKENAL